MKLSAFYWGIISHFDKQWLHSELISQCTTTPLLV